MAKAQGAVSPSWLKDLEERVHAASARLRELKSENETLRGQLAELEERLASSSDADAWSEEREEIRQRVEKLVEHLSELLDE